MINTTIPDPDPLEKYIQLLEYNDEKIIKFLSEDNINKEYKSQPSEYIKEEINGKNIHSKY